MLPQTIIIMLTRFKKVTGTRSRQCGNSADVLGGLSIPLAHNRNFARPHVMIAAPPRRIGDAQQREVSLPPDGARLAPVVLKTFYGGMTPQPYQSSVAATTA